LCGDLLVWRKGLQIFGQNGHGGKIVELTVPGEEHFWPVPLIVNGLPYVLTNTNRGRLLLYPFPPTVADGPPPKPRGWTVARGTTDFADAVPIDERFVRVVWSAGGAEVGEVIDTWHDAKELQDVEWTAMPGTFDLSDWLATRTALRDIDDVYYWRKGDPVKGTQFAAWMRVKDGQIGLLADTSTGQTRADGSIDKMYFAGPYLWAPVTGPSGWHATYTTDFVWDSHTDRDVPIYVGMECGFARFNGVEVRRRHIYDPRRDDPAKPRKMGYREYAYLADDGHEEVFEEHQDDDQGVLHLHRRVQPVPRTGPEGFVAPPRPAPFPPITGDDMQAPKVTIDQYGPVIRPGQPWTFTMHDPNNGVSVTVALRDGSVYGTFKNAKGEDTSRLFRPVAVQP
jgi:hypothetical protein